METTLLNGVSVLLLLSEPQILICHHCAPGGIKPMSFTGKFAGVYDAELLFCLSAQPVRKLPQTKTPAAKINGALVQPERDSV